jgi:hypothetical protein
MVLPASLEIVGESCFYGCRSLSEVIFAEGSHVTRLERECFSGGCPIKAIVLPASLEIVGERCFSECRSLSEVIFAEGSHVTRIDRGWFAGCSMKKIVLPVSLEIVGERCFYGCNSLSEVIFAEGSHVTRLERECFCGVGGSGGGSGGGGCPIKRIVLPASLEIVGERCFYGCRSLSEVIFAEGSHVTRLEKECFSGDYQSGCPIERIILPASL